MPCYPKGSPAATLLSLGRQGIKFHWKKQHAESWTHTKMLLFLDIKLYIPEPTCLRLVLPDSSKIGFCGCLYSILIKVTPLGTRYLLRLETWPTNSFLVLNWTITLPRKSGLQELCPSRSSKDQLEKVYGHSSWVIVGHCHSQDGWKILPRHYFTTPAISVPLQTLVTASYQEHL